MNRVAVSIISFAIASVWLVACGASPNRDAPTATPFIEVVGEIEPIASSLPQASLTPSPTPLPSSTPFPTPREVTVSRISNDINPAEVTPIAQGVNIPALTLTDLDGDSIRLDQLEKPLVLNFWSVGCGSCFYEFPLLQEFYAFHNEDGNNLDVVGINIADFPEETRLLGEQLGIDFPMVVDENAALFATYFNGAVVPTTIFIHSDGTVQEVFIGALDAYNLDQNLQAMGLVAYDD